MENVVCFQLNHFTYCDIQKLLEVSFFKIQTYFTVTKILQHILKITFWICKANKVHGLFL